MARKQSRIVTAFVNDQKALRTTLEAAPGQAGGLPELKERVEVIENILALHSYPVSL